MSTERIQGKTKARRNQLEDYDFERDFLIPFLTGFW